MDFFVERGAIPKLTLLTQMLQPNLFRGTGVNEEVSLDQLVL